MEYILTKKEYDALVPKLELDAAKFAIKKLRELLVGEKCCGDRRNDHLKTFGYCDLCPLSDIGGNHGEKRPDHELSHAMCDLHRKYSQ